MASIQAGQTDKSPQGQDEFDNPPKGPVGVHRGPKSLWIRALPYLIVILLAVVCGVGVWAGVSGFLPWQQQKPASTSQAIRKPSISRKSTSAPSEKTKETKPAPSSPVQEPSQTSSTPAPVIDKNTRVLIVNGTGVSGYAGSKRQILVDAGYGTVTASNPTGSLPAGDVVWYQNEADKATAQDVAAQLGIARVEQSAEAGSPVEVVLMH